MEMEMEMENKYFHEAKFVDEEGHLRTLKVPVVQELERLGLNHIPQMFQRPPNEVPIASSQSPLPIINMANLALTAHPLVRTQELNKLAEGAKEWGLVQLVDHGVCLSGLKYVVKSFFGLSFEEKKTSVGTHRSADNMGYGRGFVRSDDHAVDWIDRITMRAAPKCDTKGLDVWPSKPANFRQVMEDYVEESRRLLDEFLQALAEALGLDRESFLQYFEPTHSIVNIRGNYYPKCPRPNQVLGLSPHSDGSGLTLLAQFGASGGLEVRKDDKWVKIQWPIDTLVVGVGDLMEIMSNGMVLSPWHRVVTQEDMERYSIALFYNPPLRSEIGPVKDPYSDESRYKKVVVGDYMQHYYKISPTKDKEVIMFAKVNKCC